MNNIQPRTRADRDAMSLKDNIEKNYINKRSGYEARHITAQQLIHQADVQSTLYIPESQRFDKDFSVFDKQQREVKFQHQQQHLQDLRLKNLDRVGEIWNQQNYHDEKSDRLNQYHANSHEQGNRNQNIDGFNIINQEYIRNEKGKLLQTNDESAEVRYLVRQTNLSQRQNSDYNILTGQQRVHSHVPDTLRGKYDDKLSQFKNQYDRK